MSNPKTVLVVMSVGAGVLAWWMFGILVALLVLAVAILLLARRR